MKRICFIFICFLLNACSIKPEAQIAPTIYTLTLNTNIELKDKTITQKNIKIMPIQSLFYLKTNEIAYVENSNFGSYVKYTFQNSPTDTLEFLFNSEFEKSGIFKAVLNKNSQLRPDLLLEARLDNFEQIIDENKNVAKIALSVSLVDVKDKKLISSRYFSYEIELKDNQIQNLITAFDEALKQCLSDVLLWTNKSLKNN